MQRLVDQMTPQIVKYSGSWNLGLFLPTFLNRAPEPVKPGLIIDKSAKMALGKNSFHSSEVTVPSPVMVDAENNLFLTRQVDELISLFGRNGKRFLHQYIFPGFKCLFGCWEMQVIGKQDDE